MRISFLTVIFCVLGSLSGWVLQAAALPVGASLIDQNGLSWLSPYWSQGIQYSQMLDRLDNPSSDYFGLRVATAREVVDLFNAYPLEHPFIPSPFSFGAAVDGDRLLGPAYGAMDPVFNDFGWYEVSATPNFSREIGGYSWDPLTGRIMIASLSESDIYGGSAPDDYELYFFCFETSASIERPWYGTWLVEDGPLPVPESATLWLVSGGILLVVIGRRFRVLPG